MQINQLNEEQNSLIFEVNNLREFKNEQLTKQIEVCY